MRTVRNFMEGFKKLPKLAVIPVAVFVLVGVLGPYLAPYDPIAQNLINANQGPSAAHWLGTDHLGRDTLSRLIAAARTSVVGLSCVLLFALSIGILLGCVAGYLRGWVDEIIMRVVDVGQAIPSLIVALAVIGVFGTGYWNMIIALSLAIWPSYARVSRASAVTIMHRPHMEALRVLGASPQRIFFLHLLPSAIGAVLVYASADAGAIALSIATLSFLGLGIQPPTPEWGQMLVDALPFLETSPRQVLLPGAALTLVVIGFNLLGEAVALNKIPQSLSPRILKRRRLEVSQAGA